MQDITGIDHIGIRVSDLSTAREFYEKLGFDFILGPTGPEPVAILQHPCGVVINFILNADCTPDKNVLMDIQEKHAGYTHIALRVTNLNSVKEKLVQLKIHITEGPIDFGGDFGSSLFIRDQDKNVIEFHQAASP
jgi:lactoylglutathione lyase